MVLLNKNSNRKVYQILCEIMGLNQYNSKTICKKLGFQRTCKLNDLENADLERLKIYLNRHYFLDKSLINIINKQVKKKIDLGIYSGKRHNLGYPVRGQRTLSNAKTQRRLHKFRFYYESDLFSHVFFKNQRKSNKNKRLARLIAKKKSIKVTGQHKGLIGFTTHLAQQRKVQVAPKNLNINKTNYLKKLNKIKADRKKQVEARFQREHKRAQSTHPYFLNIMKGKAKKRKKT